LSRNAEPRAYTLVEIVDGRDLVILVKNSLEASNLSDAAPEYPERPLDVPVWSFGPGPCPVVLRAPENRSNFQYRQDLGTSHEKLNALGGSAATP